MNYLLNCKLDDYDKYCDKKIGVKVTDEDGKEKSLSAKLNLIADRDFKGEYTFNTDVVSCITCKSAGDFKCNVPVFLECSFDSFNGAINAGNRYINREDIIFLVSVPDGYKDMRELLSLCNKYPNVRFTGGYLLGVDGLRIGRYDDGKERMSVVFDGQYDAFTEADIDSVKVVFGSDVGKEKVVKNSKASKEKGNKKVKQTVFSTLFGDVDKVGF